jgi:hypothetical protein
MQQLASPGAQFFSYGTEMELLGRLRSTKFDENAAIVVFSLSSHWTSPGR